MAITLLISQYKHARRVAYLKDQEVIDVDLEGSFNFSCLDQIYWGRVTQSDSCHAFIKLAENQVGLLPFERPFSKLIQGEAVLVQIRREAIPDKGTQHKGPLLTRKIILGGRYCLYHPFQEKRLLSSKIQDPATRTRLQALIPAHEPYTLRESAGHASEQQIYSEMTALRKKFSDINELSSNAPCSTPYDAMLTSHRWMRDIDGLVANKILVDDNQALIDVRNFLKIYRPDLLSCVQKHSSPLFEAYALEDFWASLFDDVIGLPNGGNIVIDTTAAAIVIDINSNNRNAQETNKEAIPIIIQQLKGRHIGGNIIIDFMGREASLQERDALTALVLKQASYYSLPLDIFGWSKLGWIEARLPKRRLPLKESFDQQKGMMP